MAELSLPYFRFCPKCKCDTERKQASGRCSPCYAAYRVAEREASPEKIKSRNAAHYAANREFAISANKSYRASNPEKYKATEAARYASNPEKVKRERAARHAANPELRRVSSARWRINNQALRRIYEQTRRARKKSVSGVLSKGIVGKLYKLQKGKCPCCNQHLGDDYHIDHIMPLSLGGENTDNNIQLLRAICNMRKHAAHPVDFMQSKGFLI